MAIKVMADCGDQVLYTAEELGAVLRTFSNNTDYIIKGIGNQMAMTSSSSSLQVTVKTGEAVMCGRFVMIKSNETITLPANTTGKLVLRIDLTQPVTFEGKLAYVTGSAKSDNLNNTGTGQYDLVLAEFVTGASGVTTLTDKRVISDSSGSGSEVQYVEQIIVRKDTNESTLSTPIIIGFRKEV